MNKFIILAAATLLVGCKGVPTGPVERGNASWYSRATNTPRNSGVTASGVPLQDNASTAAHKHLPLGSVVKFTNLLTGQSEIVTITDRGPYIRGRIIDVTVGVAKRTGFYSRGVTPCSVVPLTRN